MPSILDSLTDSQKNTLLTWLETMPRAEVIKKLALKAPDGFGIAVHATSLARFQEKHNRAERDELLQSQPVPTDRDRQFLLAAGEDQLLLHVLTLLRTSLPASPLVAAAGKILAVQQDRANRRKELELRERELKLKEARFELERQTAAADLVLREAAIPNNCANDHVQSAVVQILTPAPPCSPQPDGKADGGSGCGGAQPSRSPQPSTSDAPVPTSANASPARTSAPSDQPPSGPDSQPKTQENPSKTQEFYKKHNPQETASSAANPAGSSASSLVTPRWGDAPAEPSPSLPAHASVGQPNPSSSAHSAHPPRPSA